MSTIQSTNILTREINLGAAMKKLAGFFGWLDNSFRLVPDFGLDNKSKSDDKDLQTKIADIVKNQLLDSNATLNGADRNLLLQAGYHPSLINGIKKFLAASNETTRLEATKELYKNLAVVDVESLTELLKANDANNHQVILSALKEKGLDASIGKLRSMALSSQAAAARVLTDSAIDEIVKQAADNANTNLYATYNIKGDALINKAISAKLDPKNFSASEFLTALAHKGPQAAIDYSHGCIAKLQKEIDDVLDQGIRSSASASTKKAAQIGSEVQEKIIKLRSQQLLIAKLSTNKDVFGEDVITALQKHAASNDTASAKINSITENRAEHINTLAQTLVNHWNANNSDVAYQINLSSSSTNFATAIKDKLNSLKTELSSTQATIFTAATHAELEKKLNDLDTAAAIANAAASPGKDQGLSLQIDDTIKQGLLHDETQMRMIAFAKLMGKINSLADPEKSLVLKQLEDTVGTQLPSTLDLTALEKVKSIKERVEKLENANNILTKFIAEENLKYANIYSEMQQNLSAKPLNPEKIRAEIKTLETLKANPIVLTEPAKDDIDRKSIAQYLRKLPANRAGDIEIQAKGKPPFVIAKAELEKMVQHFENDTENGAFKIKDVKDRDITAYWIEGRCKESIIKDLNAYSTPQEKAEAYHKEYKPEIYNNYQRSGIVDFIISSLKLILDELNGGSKHV